MGADDRVMARAPFTFDVSVWESFLPLTVGARLVVTRPGGHRELDYLAGVMVEHAISVAEFVPSVLAALVADGFGGALGSLRHLFAGGEELSPELAVALGSLTSAAVHNTYGPTEAAITTTAHRIVGSVSGVVRSGRRCGIRVGMCWIRGCVRCRWVLRVSCISMVRSWLVVIIGVRI